MDKSSDIDPILHSRLLNAITNGGKLPAKIFWRDVFFFFRIQWTSVLCEQTQIIWQKKKLSKVAACLEQSNGGKVAVEQSDCSTERDALSTPNTAECLTLPQASAWERLFTPPVGFHDISFCLFIRMSRLRRSERNHNITPELSAALGPSSVVDQWRCVWTLAAGGVVAGPGQVRFVAG